MSYPVLYPFRYYHFINYKKRGGGEAVSEMLIHLPKIMVLEEIELWLIFFFPSQGQSLASGIGVGR